MRQLFLLIILLLYQQLTIAQIQITGFIYNQTTGKPVDGATLELYGKKTYQTLSDATGAFTLHPNTQETYTLKITHISYTEIQKALTITKDTVLYIYLQPANNTLNEVSVKAHNKPFTSNIQLSHDEILQKGSALGEANIYEALQKQSGIIHTNEMNSGLYVRGLGTGNTGILIDGTNTFAGNHLLGIYPVINADAYSNVKLLKEDIHPQYNGYLSSYLLLETENNISDSMKGNAELGILTSKAGIQLPLWKDKIGWSTNIRRSYFDIIANTYNHLYENKKDFTPLPSYGFYDWSNTVLVKTGKQGLLKCNTLYSSDRLDMNNKDFSFDADWKNWSFSTNWQYPLSNKVQLQMNMGHSGYQSNADYMSLIKQMKNAISENSLQANLSWRTDNSLTVDYGLYAKNNQLRMNYGSENNAQSSDTYVTTQKKSAQNIGTYVFGNLTINKVVRLKFGSKLEYYQSGQSFITCSPTASVLINRWKQSIYFDISRRVQFAHLYVPLGVQLPVNIWYPSTRQAPPENAWHFTTTYSRIFNNQLRGSVSAYYISLNNQVEFLDKNYFTSLDFKTTIGKGTSKGLELNLFYNTQKLLVESHYTLGKSTCRFTGINNGKAYSMPYDIRHKMDLSLSWQWKRNWSLSFSQFLQSGFVITIPTGLYLHQDADGSKIDMREVPVYTDRNNFRMPLSHRMDLSVKHNFSFYKRKCWWTAGTYNTYGYQNPYFIYFAVVKNEQAQSFLQAKKKSILPLTPFFTIHTEF